jgi:predicted ester cyclase
MESRANEDTLGLLRQLGALPQPGGSIQVPSPVVNENLIRRYFDEVMNAGKLEVIDEIVDPGFSFHIPTLSAPVRGPDDFKQFVTVLRTAFPDLHFNVEKHIIEGAQAAARWTFSGTHRGPFLDAMPTGIRVTDQGVDLFLFLNARIVTIWVNENDFSLMQQIGLLPANKS